VDPASEHFFACSTLANEGDHDVLGSDLAQGLVEPSHHRGVHDWVKNRVILSRSRHRVAPIVAILSCCAQRYPGEGFIEA
jgi:hypothetical protein